MRDESILRSARLGKNAASVCRVRLGQIENIACGIVAAVLCKGSCRTVVSQLSHWVTCIRAQDALDIVNLNSEMIGAAMKPGALLITTMPILPSVIPTSHPRAPIGTRGGAALDLFMPNRDS